MSDELSNFLTWCDSNFRAPHIIRAAHDEYEAAQAELRIDKRISSGDAVNDLLTGLSRKPTGARLTRNKLVAYWREESLRCTQQPPRKLAIHEGKLLDQLIQTYSGSSDILKMITYFFENYKSLTYWSGYPTVSGLWGFKDRLMQEAREGKRGKLGQFNPTAGAKDEWG
jgi:hypothetical protein